ncbi:MAG TPA: PEP-CTERM sorting domain-containing protein [Pirellulales bacterium]
MKFRTVLFVIVILISASNLQAVELVVMATNTTAVPGAKVYTVGVQVTQADLAAQSGGVPLGLQELAFVGPILNSKQTTAYDPTQLQTIQSQYIDVAAGNNPVAPGNVAGPPINLSPAGQSALYDSSWWYWSSTGRLNGVADSSGNSNVITSSPAADGSGVYTVGPTSNVGASGALWQPIFPSNPTLPGMSAIFAEYGSLGVPDYINQPPFSNLFVNGVYTAPLAQIVASGDVSIPYQPFGGTGSGTQGMLIVGTTGFNFLGGNSLIDPHAVLDFSTNTIHSELTAGGGAGNVGGIAVDPAVIAASGTLTSTFTTTSAANLGSAIGADAAQQINFALAGPTAQAWDIQFTGFLQGLSTVVLHYDPTLIGNTPEADLRIEHYDNGIWVAPTGQVVDTVAHTITFQTASFSPFVLAQAPEPATIVLAAFGGFALLLFRRRRETVRTA